MEVCALEMFTSHVVTCCCSVVQALVASSLHEQGWALGADEGIHS